MTTTAVEPRTDEERASLDAARSLELREPKDYEDLEALVRVVRYLRKLTRQSAGETILIMLRSLFDHA